MEMIGEPVFHVLGYIGWNAVDQDVADLSGDVSGEESSRDHDAECSCVRLITVCKYGNVNEASLALANLQSQGFDAFLQNTFASIANPIYGLSDDIHLQVPPDQVEEARALLQSTARKVYSACPECHSENIIYGPERLSLWLWILSILTICFPLSFTAKSYRCRDCEHKWK